MDEIKLKKLEAIIAAIEIDTPSTKEVAELVATIIQVVQETRKHLEKQALENKRDLNNLVNHLTEQEVEKISEALDNLEKKAEKAIKSVNEKTKLDLDTITIGFQVELSKLKDSIPEKADFTEIYDKIKGVERKIVPPKEIEAMEIRDKIESLEGDERLDRKSIKGLDEELKRIEKTASTAKGGVRRVYQPYVDDFSGDTDGLTKIFYLSREPLNANTVLVWGTDFPVILRPTTDFTIAGKKLTLTSAIPAPNIGATLLVRYDA